jgi:fumarylacetoacetase
MMATANYSHHFSHRNIPFGIASSQAHEKPQAVSRLGNTILFLHDLHVHGLFKESKNIPENVFNQPTLNSFAALSKSEHRYVREKIQEVFRHQGLEGFPSASKEDADATTMHLPIVIKDFTGTFSAFHLIGVFSDILDFSCSLHHVINAGRIVVGDPNPPPGFFKFPVGYQGRTSSIVVSGTDIERPYGHFRSPKSTNPQSEEAIIFGPSQKVDYEVELAAVIGEPLPMKKRLHAEDADNHIFGFVILNDWSCECLNPKGF